MLLSTNTRRDNLACFKVIDTVFNFVTRISDRTDEVKNIPKRLLQAGIITYASLRLHAIVGDPLKLLSTGMLKFAAPVKMVTIVTGERCDR